MKELKNEFNSMVGDVKVSPPITNEEKQPVDEGSPIV